MVGYTGLGLFKVSPNLSSLHGREQSSFPGCVPHNDTVNSKSLVVIKPGNSGVVIGYQVDKFVCT